MRNLLIQLLCSTLLMGVIACSNPEKMKDLASDIKITSNPQVLEVNADKIKSVISVTFPPKYFNKKAVLEMLPVLKDVDGKELTFEPKMLRGEDITENYDVIPNEAGGSYSQEVSFNYTDNLRKSTLYLRPTLIVKGKRLQFPVDLKVADGVNATVKLAESADGLKVMFLEDQYVFSTTESKNAQITYLINSADVRTKELKSEPVQSFNQFVVDGQKSQALSKISISAYASPDGPETLNEKLSKGRGKSSNKAILDLFKKNKIKVAPEVIEILTITEDWDGFKALMENSNIQDKDLVLRILSMYSDPAVREKEIKNIAQVYKEIADNILPQLRRAKMTAQIEVKNLTQDQIKALVDQGQLDSLDVEQLLYCKKIYNDDATLKKVFEFAANKFSDYRAYNNLGAVLLNAKDFENAKRALETAAGLNSTEKAIKNNLGYALLFLGNEEEGLKMLTEAATEESKLGLAGKMIKDGNYTQAVSLLNGSGTFNEALVKVLTSDLEGAKKVAEKLQTAKSSYLLGIIAARQGQEAEVLSNVKKAFDMDAKWKEYIKKDIEFVAFLAKLGV